MPYENGFQRVLTRMRVAHTNKSWEEWKEEQKSGRQAAYFSQVGSIPLFHNAASDAKSSTSSGVVTDRRNRLATANRVRRTVILPCCDDKSQT